MSDSETLKNIQKDVTEIKHCLLGTMGSHGLVKRVDEMEKVHGLVKLQIAGLMSLVPIVIGIVYYFINH